MTEDTDWQAKATAIKANITAKIPKEYLLPKSLYPLPLDVSNIVGESNLLSPLELKIISQDATGIRDAIASRTYTSVAVAIAFAKASAICHQATNCLLDYFPDEAIERAKWLDGEMERTGKIVGSLHGVPISVKGEFGFQMLDVRCWISRCWGQS